MLLLLLLISANTTSSPHAATSTKLKYTGGQGLVRVCLGNHIWLWKIVLKT